MIEPEIPEFDVRDPVMVAGNYRSVIFRVKTEMTREWASAHFCLRAADSRDPEMNPPPLSVGSLFRLKKAPTIFVVSKISADNTAKENTDQPVLEGEEGHLVVQICIEGVDQLEAQRQQEREVEDRQWRRRLMAHLREEEGL